MAIKLNKLAVTRALTSAPGNFVSVAQYCATYGTPGTPEAVIATMNAAMAGKIREFYSPILPRGLRLNTAKEVFEADLDVQHVRISPAPDAAEPEIIVSGHAGTRELLAEQYPLAVIFEGNVAPEQIAGKMVVGTLPPHLVALTKAYVYVGIADFDYAKDGDLGGDELRKRLIINSPIRVTAE